MNKHLYLTIAFTFFILNIRAQTPITVEHFDKVIISPHIQVTFVQADHETVTIDTCKTDVKKVNIESKGKTLRIYLEDAKEVTKNEEIRNNGTVTKVPIYQGKILTVTVTYTELKSLSIRGEESAHLKSAIEQDNFNLKIYGESKVYFDKVKLNELRTTIYGESYLELKSGNITEQRLTAYGESKVEALGIESNVARLTLYGESKLNLNVADQINITAFGDAEIGYKGNPQIRKGITIGEVKTHKIN
nr:head GIN domain-containing protein [uncultured Pedobacter sp.]